jgi:pimeloyl-ACP methyl ester carboxylesterase
VVAAGTIAGTSVYLYCTSETAAGAGLGLIGPNERIIVTGHSLGGHLAAVAARLFPSLVSDCYTYNAPGFDPTTANGASSLAQSLMGQLAAQFGPAVMNLLPMAQQLSDELIANISRQIGNGAETSFGAVPIHRLDSHIILPASETSIVSSYLTGAPALGPEIQVASEANSHMIEPFVDSLALQALLYRLNGQLTLADMGPLFAAAAPDMPHTQERLVEALYKLFKGSAIDLPVVDANSVSGIGTGEAGARRSAANDFHLRNAA